MERDIALLPFATRTKLLSLYFEIDNHNYEAKRVRDVSVIVNSSIQQTGIETYWKELSIGLKNNEQELKKKITEALQDPSLE